jgi:TolB protein
MTRRSSFRGLHPAFLPIVYMMLGHISVPAQHVLAWNPSDSTNRKVAFVSDRDGWPTIYEINADGSDLHAVRPAEASAFAGRPVWSPDGQFLAFSVYYNDDRDTIVNVVSRDGDSSSFTVSGSNLDASPSWSPDSKQIVFVSNRDAGLWQLYTTTITTGREQQLVSDRTGDDYSAVWSPDGQQIAFVRGKAATAGLYVMNADGTNPRFLATTFSLKRVAWSPDGKTIAYTPGNSNNSKVCLIHIDGTGQRCIPGLSETFSPAWSADGQHIAFSGVREGHADLRSHRTDIYVIDADLTNPQRLTFDGDPTHSNDAPVWSPDSTKLAFIVTTEHNVSIYTINVDGSGLRQLLEESPGTQLHGLAWQP